MSDRLLLAASLPLLLLAPLVGAFVELQLPLSEVSVIAMLALIGASAAAAGYVAGLAKENRRTTWLAAAIIAAAICIFLDMVTRGNAALTQLSDNRSVRLLVAGIGFFSVAGMVWLIRDKVARILFAGALAFFASSIVVPTAFAADGSESTVYIVLDEMIGLSGIDVGLPGGKEAKTALSDVFERHGFRYFPNAFSRHYMTQRSLPAVHNYDFNDNDPGIDSRYAVQGAGSKLAVSRLFDDAVARGHTISVFQTEHLDFCLAIVTSCETFDSFNPASRFVDYESTLLAVAFTAARTFAGSYTWGIADAILSRLAGDRYSAIPTTYDAHGFPRWFKHFANEVQNGENTFVYSHFLMPHAPSIFDRECVMHERLDAGYKLVEEQGLQSAEAARRRKTYYSWYFDQVICLTTKLDLFFAELEQHDRWRDATVVVHGDHGSRIAMASLAENISEQDMIDSYSTLYAIRGQDIDPGIDPRQVSVQRLTAEYFSGMDRLELGDDNNTVAVDSVEPGRAKIKQMPSLAPL